MGSQQPQPNHLPALKTQPKFIFFTDFDGTITKQDSNDYLTDNLGFGPAQRKSHNNDVLSLRRDFRDSFQEMLDSVSAHAGFATCIDTLIKNITLDEGFKAFFEYAGRENIPIVILSGGMEPIIRALLVEFLGREKADSMQIVSNQVAPRREGGDINQVGGWTIVYHDDRCVTLIPFPVLICSYFPSYSWSSSSLSFHREGEMIMSAEDEQVSD